MKGGAEQQPNVLIIVARLLPTIALGLLIGKIVIEILDAAGVLYPQIELIAGVISILLFLAMTFYATWLSAQEKKEKVTKALAYPLVGAIAAMFLGNSVVFGKALLTGNGIPPEERLLVIFLISLIFSMPGAVSGMVFHSVRL